MSASFPASSALKLPTVTLADAQGWALPGTHVDPPAPGAAGRGKFVATWRTREQLGRTEAWSQLGK